MSATHPRLVQTTVVKGAVGRRYEVTLIPGHLLSARLVFGKATGADSYPFTDLSTLDGVRARIHTAGTQEAGGRVRDIAVLCVEKSRLVDHREWEPERAPLAENGVFVDFESGVTPMPGQIVTAYLELNWVASNALCPAAEPVDEWRKKCGFTDQSGFLEEREPWADNGSLVPSFLINPEQTGYLIGPEGGFLLLATA